MKLYVDGICGPTYPDHSSSSLMSTNIDSPDNPLHSVATEFVAEEFDIEVQTAAIEEIAGTIEDLVATLRELINSDDQLEALLRSEPGQRVLMEQHSVHHSDPEPLTRGEIIEPLFEALDYPYLAPEAGDLSDERGKQADYSVSLADHDAIDSNRMLIEAEPLNKKLDQQRHGIGQVKDWLGKRHFEADFGIATDGMRWIFIRYDPDTYSCDKLAEVNLQPVFLAAFENLPCSRRNSSHTLRSLAGIPSSAMRMRWGIRSGSAPIRAGSRPGTYRTWICRSVS